MRVQTEVFHTPIDPLVWPIASSSPSGESVRLYGEPLLRLMSSTMCQSVVSITTIAAESCVPRVVMMSSLESGEKTTERPSRPALRSTRSHPVVSHTHRPPLSEVAASMVLSGENSRCHIPQQTPQSKLVTTSQV